MQQHVLIAARYSRCLFIDYGSENGKRNYERLVVSGSGSGEYITAYSAGQ
jgi:hypothetical protein